MRFERRGEDDSDGLVTCTLLPVHIRLTQWDWFARLRARPDLDEVNFWKPSPDRLPRLDPGDLFLFKLHRKATGGRDVVAGGGVFARSLVAPVSLAWETFGPANGADSLEGWCRDMSLLLGRQVNDASPIGCILIQEPFFFDEPAWIPLSGWPAPLQVGKNLDPMSPEGALLLRALEERPLPAGMVKESAEGPRVRPVIALQRLGQRSFELAVVDAYSRHCAITGEKVLPALEAAHIVPFAEGGPSRVDNGLLLRRDVHRLFDRGYVTVTPEYRVEVSPRIRTEFEDGRNYYELRGSRIRLPESANDFPSREFLAWHNDRVFRLSA